MTIRLHRGDLPDLSRYTGPAVAVDTEAMGLDPKLGEGRFNRKQADKCAG